MKSTKRYGYLINSFRLYVPWWNTLDGARHWLLTSPGDNKPMVVLSSDVGDELRVALGLVNVDKMECCFEIWNLNYKHKNWTKQLSVGPFCVIKPLGFWKNGGFLCKDSPAPCRWCWTTLVPINWRILVSLILYVQVTIYRESLIPISGDYSLYVFFYIPCHILGVSQVVVMSMKCKSFFFFS